MPSSMAFCLRSRTAVHISAPSIPSPHPSRKPWSSSLSIPAEKHSMTTQMNQSARTALPHHGDFPSGFCEILSHHVLRMYPSGAPERESHRGRDEQHRKDCEGQRESQVEVQSPQAIACAGDAGNREHGGLYFHPVDLVAHRAPDMLLADYRLAVELFFERRHFLSHLLKFVVVFHFSCL